VGKEFELFRNDGGACILALLLPSAIAVVWIGSVKMQPENIPVAICDLTKKASPPGTNGGALGAWIARRLEAAPEIGAVRDVDRPEDIEALMRKEIVTIGIVVAERDAAAPGETQGEPYLSVEADGASLGTVMYELGPLERLLADIRDGYRRAPAKASPDGIEFRVRFNPDRAAPYFMLPGLAAILSSWVSSVLAALSIARERRGSVGLYVRSLPIGQAEMLVSATAVPLLLGLINVILITCSCASLHGIAIASAGTLVNLAAASLLPLAAAACLGALLGWTTRTPIGNALAAGFLFICNFFLSGWWYPLYELPAALRAVSFLVPATQHVGMARSLLFRGATLSDVWPHVVASAGLCLVCFAGAWIAAKRAASRGR
jgi:ABC-2 type transport system permease protein